MDAGLRTERDEIVGDFAKRQLLGGVAVDQLPGVGCAGLGEQSHNGSRVGRNGAAETEYPVAYVRRRSRSALRQSGRIRRGRAFVSTIWISGVGGCF